MGDWITCKNCGEGHPVAEPHQCPWPQVFDQLDAIYAHDTGCVDSGVRDEALRRRLFEQINAAPEEEVRLVLSRWIRDGLLSEDSLTQRYGWEDVREFLNWFEASRAA